MQYSSTVRRFPPQYLSSTIRCPRSDGQHHSSRFLWAQVILWLDILLSVTPLSPPIHMLLVCMNWLAPRAASSSHTPALLYRTCRRLMAGHIQVLALLVMVITDLQWCVFIYLPRIQLWMEAHQSPSSVPGTRWVHFLIFGAAWKHAFYFCGPSGRFPLTSHHVDTSGSKRS